jgi:SEC-C motif
MNKIGRNDTCSCGSGKKYKKCCEMQAKTKKFRAEVISSGPQAANLGSKVASLFGRSAVPVVVAKSNESSEIPAAAAQDP